MDFNHNGADARQSGPLIEARDVRLALDGAPILRGASLALRPGEMVGLIGPNGAGKTTLLKVLGGLLRRTGGDLRLAGHPLDDYSPREVARLAAHVPQSTTVEFAFTVREVVLMGRSPHLGRFELERALDRQIADRVMQQMNILGLAERFVTTLSGGERQRTFIARALAQQPRLLLLDEPTANLDVRHQLDVLDMVARLAAEQGLGVIAAIHDLNLAAQFCGRLVLLHRGRVLADDRPDAVLTPHHLDAVFGVEAQVYRDPFNEALRLSLERNGNGKQEDAAGVESARSPRPQQQSQQGV
jgi:iron complex transport system ATP-binding protein